jgi:hypothetical protein
LLSISELHLRGRIVSIDADTFKANRRLQHLDLKNCQLRRLSVDAFQSLRKLRLLDLSSNQLVQLPPGLFDPVVSLKELWLNGNKLTTDVIFWGEQLFRRENVFTARSRAIFPFCFLASNIGWGSIVGVGLL